MIILSGIVAGLPGAVGNTAEAVSSGEMQGPFALLLIILVLGTTAFVVFVERAQRRIAVNYAKRQVGRRMYAAMRRWARSTNTTKDRKSTRLNSSHLGISY